MFIGCVSLGNTHHISEAPTLSSQGKEGVGEGLRANPTLTGVEVPQDGTYEVTFSKENMSQDPTTFCSSRRNHLSERKTHTGDLIPPDPYKPGRVARPQLLIASL